MKCPRCLNELKLVAGTQNPRKSHCSSYGKPDAVSLTYRDYYYCPKCDKSFTATINLRTECKNTYEEMKEWKI